MLDDKTDTNYVKDAVDDEREWLDMRAPDIKGLEKTAYIQGYRKP